MELCLAPIVRLAKCQFLSITTYQLINWRCWLYAQSRRGKEVKSSLIQAKRFNELLEQMAAIRASKNKDYATAEDGMSNLRMCEQMGIPAWKGVVIRISDKFSRIMQL